MKNWFVKQGYFDNIDAPNKLGLTKEVTNIISRNGLPTLINCCESSLPTDGQILVYNEIAKSWIPTNSSAGGVVNLGYTPSFTQGTITNSGGTSAIIPLANNSDAGLLSPILNGVLSSLNNSFVPTQVPYGANANGYISSSNFTFDGTNLFVDGTLHVTGKVTFDDILDPTGVVFTKVASNPSSTAPNDTIWINSANNHLYRGSVDLEALGSTTFSALTDVAPIAGQAGKTLQINNTSNGVIYVEVDTYVDAFGNPII